MNSSPDVAASSSSNGPLLEVRDLRTWFPRRSGVLRRTVDHERAVDGVSFDLRAGETLGLVGESGCGKTTVARTILRLIPATGGTVRFQGRSVFDQSRTALKRMRREMQIIFQDPASSLNPRLRVGRIVGEPMLVHGIARGAELRSRVSDLLVRCGLWPGAADRFQHEFSGGQRQRIAIARALALRPKLIVCDEPTSALDVSIQSQILNLLQDLQDEFRIAYLFISHDMAVVHHVCDRIAVMNAGRIVEMADCDTLLADPQHEYTRTLLAAVPKIDPGKAMLAGSA
jgi:ABC-type glutathione transport system ATPase component